MSTWKVDDSELKKFRQDLKRFPDNLEKTVDKRWRGVLDEIVADARKRAPRLTGRLARGIRPEGGQVIGIVSTAPHAGIFEFGGKHPVFGRKTAPVIQTARPYLFPAVKSNEEKLIKVSEDAVTETAEKTL